MNRSSKDARSASGGALPLQVLGVLLLAVGLLVLVSLVSHSPEDPPNSSRPPEMAQNLAGWLGAHLSYRLLFLAGYGAILLNATVFLWGWTLFTHADRRRAAWRSLSLIVILTLFCAGSGLPSGGHTHQAFLMGGWIGVTLSSLVLVPYLGQVGSLILLGAGGLILLMVATNVPVHRFPDLVVVGLGRLWAGIWGLLTSVIRIGPWTRTQGRRAWDWGTEIRARRKIAKARRMEEAEAMSAEEVDAGGGDPVFEEAFEETFDEPEIDTSEAEIESPIEPAPPALPSSPADLEPSTTVPPRIVRTKKSRRGGSSSKPKQGNSELDYEMPSLDLLSDPPHDSEEVDKDYLLDGAQTLEESLSSFGVDGRVVQVNPGPVITSFEVQPPSGVKVSRIVTLADDLAMVMKARSIRIMAPIPGKAAVGIEVPNPVPRYVYLREVLDTPSFQRTKANLMVGLGKTVTGEPMSADLAKMPHLLIAGATGSGKSFCINSLIASILFRNSPDEVRFIMVDPKMLELSVYEGIPHLFSPVVTDPKVAADALKWAVAEMENRYRTMSRFSVRNIADFNKKLERLRREAESDEDREELPEKLPYLVVVVDELADLMMTAPADIENSLARLAQMARAVGIHLIIATQRPSVNVITGTIKANFPSRIAFRVASKVDSRTILDCNGAEKLLGNGDMLFLPSGKPEPIRAQGAYIETEETERIVEFAASQSVTLDTVDFGKGMNDFDFEEDARDERFDEALKLVVLHQQGSASLLQRRMKVGYARAARLVDELERAGIVGTSDGSSKARPVLVGEDYLEALLETEAQET